MQAISDDMQRDRANCYKMMKSDTVQMELARRSTERASKLLVDNTFQCTRDERLQLLWKVANDSAKLIYDKEGNEVLMNGAVSVSAVRAMNDMIDGSYATKETNVNIKIEDKRTEKEISDNIRKLTEQFSNMTTLEAEATKLMNIPALAPAIEAVAE